MAKWKLLWNVWTTNSVCSTNSKNHFRGGGDGWWVMGVIGGRIKKGEGHRDIDTITPKLALSAPQYWLPEKCSLAWPKERWKKQDGKWKPLLVSPSTKNPFSTHSPHSCPWAILNSCMNFEREQFLYLSQYSGSVCAGWPLETQQSVTFQFPLSTCDLVTRCLRCDFPQRCIFITIK